MTDPVATNVRHHDGEIETLWTGATVTHRFVEACGLRWHAATAGDPTNQDVVVFLHGFPESWFAWHHQLGALADRLSCTTLYSSDSAADSHYAIRLCTSLAP